MKKELFELQEAFEAHDEANIAEETADLFLMLLAIAHRMEFDLLDVAIRKFIENIQRKWHKPDENGIVEHVPEAAPGPFTHAHPEDMPSDRVISKRGL